jgi:hypothetical protein
MSFAQAMDPATGHLSGEPVAMVDARRVSVRDNGVLAYQGDMWSSPVAGGVPAAIGAATGKGALS